MQKAERREWSDCDDEGNDTYTLVTVYYHNEHGATIAGFVEYSPWQHVDQTDDPAISGDPVGEILDDIDAHPCELNRLTNRFEIVSCWEGCEVCE